MKTLKEVPQNSGQNEEDCGVWLDTVKLKGNAKKKRTARPISKLLNPFVDGAGYNVAVALNFTQTKIEMPKTKQSSISNFFTGQRRVLNKMSTTEGPNTGAQQASFPSVNAIKSTTEDFCDFSNKPLRCDVDNEQRNDQPNEPGPKMWWELEDEESHSPSQKIFNDFKEESSVDKSPQMKRRIFEHALPSYNCENNVRKNCERNFFESFPSQIDFNAFEDRLLNTGGKTSTQKTSKGLFLQNDKENTMPKSPKKTIRGSQTHSVSENVRVDSLFSQNEGSKSPFKWTKPKTSPMKKQKWPSCRDSDDESLSMLFTQDSQGFRVIAHRNPKTQSPLKDQTNINVLVPAEIKCLEEDDDDEEMLFTQDSQGNLVIKH